MTGFPTPWQRIMWMARQHSGITLTHHEVDLLIVGIGSQRMLSDIRPVVAALLESCRTSEDGSGVLSAVDVQRLAANDTFKRCARQHDEDERRAERAAAELHPHHPGIAQLPAFPGMIRAPNPPGIVLRSEAPTEPPPAHNQGQPMTKPDTVRPAANTGIEVLTSWLGQQAQRFIIMSMDGDGWRAEAAVFENDHYVTVLSSGGEDCVGLPSHGAALESLDAEIAREALSLVRATPEQRRVFAEHALEKREAWARK